MSKRNPNNLRARHERTMRAALRSHHVAVVHIEPAGRQGLIDWKKASSIPPGRTIADAVCDIAHHWVIYLGAFCVAQDGSRYIKAEEVAPRGIYRSDSLADVIEEYSRALLDTCNPAHVVGYGWIANPGGASLDEEQAARVFEAVGAWKQNKEAA